MCNCCGEVLSLNRQAKSFSVQIRWTRRGLGAGPCNICKMAARAESALLARRVSGGFTSKYIDVVSFELALRNPSFRGRLKRGHIVAAKLLTWTCLPNVYSFCHARNICCGRKCFFLKIFRNITCVRAPRNNLGPFYTRENKTRLKEDANWAI